MILNTRPKYEYANSQFQYLLLYAINELKGDLRYCKGEFNDLCTTNRIITMVRSRRVDGLDRIKSNFFRILLESRVERQPTRRRSKRWNED